jgi:hypothetical protein
MVTFSIGRRAAAVVLSVLALAGVVSGCAATSPVSVRPAAPVSVRPTAVPAGTAGTGCPQGGIGGTASPAGTTVSWPAASRAGVPWRSVGRGWILADVARSAAVANSPGTLYLASPGGQRYRLGPAPANAFLQDWSGDGTHALFLDPNLSPSSASVIVLDLQTGRASSFAVNTATSSVTATFSRSAGTAILVLASAAGGGFLPLQRFSLTGAQELCYPAGAVAGAYGNYQENANGTAIVFSTQYGIEVVSSSGQLVRALATQYGPGACQLLNWWNDQSVLAACSGGLLAFPLSGGPPDRLTTSRDRGSFLGAWHLTSGTYAEDGACGSTWLERLNPDGTATRLTVPGTPDGGRVQPLGADGDQLPVQVSGGCAPSPSSFVEWYNPADGVARPVLGGPAGGGYVTDSILFPAG